MNLQIEPYHQNNYPIGGVLIQGSQALRWVVEIQAMGLSLEHLVAYPIPDTTPNSVWGCFVMLNSQNQSIDIRLNTLVQKINNQLYIPEKTILYPSLSNNDLDKLFLDNPSIFHPTFGLVELSEPINWLELIALPLPQNIQVRCPADSVFIPKRVSSFQVIPLSAEATLEQMEEKIFPKKESFEDKPLSLFEKIKRQVYRQLFTKKESTDSSSSVYEEKPLFGIFKAIANLFSNKGEKLCEEMVQDLDELERRSQKYLDKLLDMLKNNPEEALKYAIPLDDGALRGDSSFGSFDFAKRWSDFSLFGNLGNSSGGSAFFGDDGYHKLHQQYYDTAQKLIQQKEYHKAAFVFMKLMKDNYNAAQTLENGGLYQDAASVFLKYVKDKSRAAICYEKGKMFNEAIELYKELNQNEKVGDLYVGINRQKEGFAYYQKVVDEYENTHQYVKASLVYKNKMHDTESGQEKLLTGWRLNRDAFNCLNNYFSNISNEPQRWHELVNVYKNDVSTNNQESFLNIVKHEFERKTEFCEGIRDIAYEIITKQIKTNPSIVSELKTYNRKDTQIVKDTIRYKLKASGKQ
jgi:tetratricopeptide (TPR) repeat protein